MLATLVMAMVFKNNEQGRALLRRGRRLAPDFALGAGLGIVVFLLVYGPSTLDVTYDSWIYCGYMEQDIIQRYAGWLYYRAADWSWPLTVANNLTLPYGASIAYTDSIPLVAILCKALSPVLPATFQYFGWVNLLNFALQGGFAALLLREVSLSRLNAAVGSLLFVLAPVFIERAFRHDALGAQWMVLWALWLYLRARHTGRIHAVSFFLLCSFSPVIHTYFTPMVYAILAAVLAEYIMRERKWQRPALVLGACFGGSLAVGYATGLLTRGGGGSGDGFGRYSLNLNGLFNPTSFDWYNPPADNLVWSSLLPVREQGYFQYEGFNYLGFGVLLGLCALAVYGLVRLVLAAARKDRDFFARLWAFVKSHLPLVVVCLCLSAFALSNVVMWDGQVLFTIPLPDFIFRLCGIFRASGRLFWPVYYLLLLVLVMGAAKLLRRWGLTACIVAVLALQLVDTGSVLWQKHDYFAAGPLAVENVYTSEEWIFMMENYDTLWTLERGFDYSFAAGVIRYNPEMKTNLRLTNRGDFPLLETGYIENSDWIAGGGELAPGVLYVLREEHVFYSLLVAAHPDVRGYRVGEFYMIGLPVEGCPAEMFVFNAEA